MLDLLYNNIGDEGLNAFANNLANNSSLKELLINGNPGTQTDSRWNFVEGVFGDSGDQPNDTHLSKNHTLWRINLDLPDGLSRYLPDIVYNNLQLNRNDKGVCLV